MRIKKLSIVVVCALCSVIVSAPKANANPIDWAKEKARQAQQAIVDAANRQTEQAAEEARQRRAEQEARGEKPPLPTNVRTQEAIRASD
jgi:hypothetical protein